MIALSLLAEAAVDVADAVPVQAVGWTWAATMGAVQNVLLVALGGGGGGLLIRALVQLKKIANERAKQEDDRDAGRWGELQTLNDKLQARVERLEGEVRDERKRADDETTQLRRQHNEEIAAMRREHVAEVRALNERFDALQRMMLQNQLSTAEAIANKPNAPKSVEAFESVSKNLRNSMGGGE